MPNANFLGLPAELQVLIFKELEPLDISALRLACTSTNDLWEANSELLTKHAISTANILYSNNAKALLADQMSWSEYSCSTTSNRPLFPLRASIVELRRFFYFHGNTKSVDYLRSKVASLYLDFLHTYTHDNGIPRTAADYQGHIVPVIYCIGHVVVHVKANRSLRGDSAGYTSMTAFLIEWWDSFCRGTTQRDYLVWNKASFLVFLVPRMSQFLHVSDAPSEVNRFVPGVYLKD